MSSICYYSPSWIYFSGTRIDFHTQLDPVESTHLKGRTASVVSANAYKNKDDGLKISLDCKIVLGAHITNAYAV